MEKIKQHYMIPLIERNFHPIFKLSYLPENVASLIETIFLLVTIVSVVTFLPSLIINNFDIQISNNAILYIYYGYLNEFFAALHLPNNVASNTGVLLVSLVVYYLIHKYFEFVKYNLHVLRNMQNKNDKKA